MPEPYKFPWGLKPLDPMVEKEFQRRVKDYNLNPTSSPSDSAPYSGPRTAWIRVFSNGISKDDEENGTPNGFVLGGTEGFDESYGFAPSAYDMEATDGKVTIGVDCWGDKHEISATPTDPSLGVGSDTPHRPPPSVVSLETEFSGGNNSGFNATCRKTKISWKCYSLSQLEYLTPYFLTPRITILAEWGWNNYDPSSLVDLTSTETLYKIFKGDKEEIDNRIRRSHGNYDLALGFITDYGYTMNDFGGFDGYTTITNANYLVEGKSYQNRQDSKQDNTNPSASLKLKDFKEFVFEDMDNLTIKNTNARTVRVENPRYSGPYGGNIYGGNYSPTYTEERDASTDIKINTKYKVFKNDDDQWMRMDLVAEIINQFFSIKFLDSNNKEVDVAAGVLDIREVPICAHPAIKSTNRNFIIPNKFAPRFVSKSDSTKDDSLVDKEARRLSDIKQVGSISTTQNPSPNGEYAKLFPDILKVIEENKLDDTFDNLVSALNTGGARTKYGSFPQFKDYEDNVNNKGYPKAGYWGYLEDVFVSVKYFKGLVEKHETVLRLIEELLQGISECMCNIAQLQLKPDTVGNVRKFVIDNNFTPIGDDRSAEKLPRFVLNATNNAFMKSNSITIKISTDMMNQMVMQSANQKQIPSEYGTATYDPKSMKYSVFQRGDRMFNCGVFTPKQIQDSNSSTDNGKGKFTRMFTEQNPDLYVYIYNPTKKGQNFLERLVGTGTDSDEANQVYILTETNSNFLKTILLDMKNASKAVYTNNGIMPGTDFKMEFLGLSGITFLSQFTLDHVPRTYSYKNAVWQISDVRHRVENKIWTTSITAQARPFITINEKV